MGPLVPLVRRSGTAYGPAWPPLRSDLASYYRRATDGDWRDYHENAYTDDGPSPHEDCDHCFGTRTEHWEDCTLEASA